MQAPYFFFFMLSAFIAVYTLSWIILKYADSLSLIDFPNKRSSHTTPVPRGAGIAIAGVFLILLLILQLHLHSTNNLFVALYVAGAPVAFIGFMDDLRHIPIKLRLSVHFFSAASVLYIIFLLPSPTAFTQDVYLCLTFVISMFFLVWILNLYNFMDGIDTITCSETISVCLGAAALSWYTSSEDPSWIILLLLSSAVAGFLVWNLPPAKLFMGDSGSAFLGIVIGSFVVHAKLISDSLFYAWIILLAVYLVDTSLTLARRIFAGKKFYQAHRTHAYQNAALLFRSHGKVSVVIALINTLVLLPMAWAVVLDLISIPLAILITYLPLTLVAIYFKAGASELN